MSLKITMRPTYYSEIGMDKMTGTDKSFHTIKLSCCWSSKPREKAVPLVSTIQILDSFAVQEDKVFWPWVSVALCHI